MTKAKTSSKLILPSTSGALVAPASWQDQYADQLTKDKASATGGSGWPWLSTKDKTQFKLGTAEYGNTINVVVLGGIRENALYKGAYDPQNTAGPDCWAIDVSGDEAHMAPPAVLQENGAENSLCASCWANAFKSDDRGRGKKCKNQVRLAVLYAGGDGDPPQNWDKVSGARLRVPPTSLSAWSDYANGVVESLNRPLCTVVTRLSIKTDDVTQFKLSFDTVGVYNDTDTVDTLVARSKEARQWLVQEPGVDAAPDVPKGGKPTQVRRKVIKKKKVTRKKR